ncbi:hypothetical protein [Desulfosarcina sp.]|uniref:hypothetical protein n=1 Tax=Desulfosarcina sp. TaxID=2027861 RepID=UPI00356AE77C
MQNAWNYKKFEIQEGLKPGSKTFRYFFKVLDSGQKKCNYCVWILDDALTRFDASKDFNAIVASRRDAWHEWVKAKIDDGDFRNRALKIEQSGEQEINLSDLSDHVTVD